MHMQSASAFAGTAFTHFNRYMAHRSFTGSAMYGTFRERVVEEEERS